jgi:hypothetical protein
MNVSAAVVGSSPTSGPAGGVRLAALRALRTLLQGVAGAFPSAGAGTVILETTYWKTFLYSVLAALIAAGVSFLQNAASFLPPDPTQKPAT